jgi:hypothetical protein
MQLTRTKCNTHTYFSCSSNNYPIAHGGLEATFEHGLAPNQFPKSRQTLHYKVHVGRIFKSNCTIVVTHCFLMIFVALEVLLQHDNDIHSHLADGTRH